MKYDKIIHVSNGSIIAVYGDSLWKIFNAFKSNRKEYQNALLIKDLEFNKPKLKGQKIIGGTNPAVCYEYIDVPDKDLEQRLDKYVQIELKDEYFSTEIFNQYATHISDLHKSIIKNKVPKALCYKTDLKKNITRNTLLSKEDRQNAIQVLKSLPVSDYLCHGDFCLSNIILKEEKAYCIDFSPLCRGPKLFDIAKFVYKSVLLHPKPNNLTSMIKLNHKKILVDKYLIQMNVSMDDLKDYLYVLKASDYRHLKPNKKKKFIEQSHKYYPCIDAEYFNNLNLNEIR